MLFLIFFFLFSRTFPASISDEPCADGRRRLANHVSKRPCCVAFVEPRHSCVGISKRPSRSKRASGIE